MKKKKEYCKNLYNRYKELKEKTKLEAKDLRPGGKIKAKYISPEDMKEREKVKNELYEYLDFLSDDQLIDLLDDPDLNFQKRIHEVLRKKRINK